jgi:hypothetical protein
MLPLCRATTAQEVTGGFIAPSTVCIILLECYVFRRQKRYESSGWNLTTLSDCGKQCLAQLGVGEIFFVVRFSKFS